MLNPFLIVSISLCLYEIISLIMPLKASMWLKILGALILFTGLGKSMLYHRTATGFALYNVPYLVEFFITVIYNFIIVTLFMLLIKDVIFIAWKIFARHVNFPGHQASLFVFSLSLCATLYGTYQGLRIPDVNKHDIYISNLGPGLDGIKIAMLVDIHADQITDSKFVEAVVNKTNALSPDVILIPGDFVDGQVKDRFSDIEPLKNLRATFGVYGVTGNHEYYSDYNGWLKEFKNFGIRILENEHVVIKSGDSKLIVAGLPDSTGGRMGMTAPDLQKALESAPDDSPVILMEHKPTSAPENAAINKNIFLQVSGHTHGGQMPGLYTLVKRANRGFVRGWYEVSSMKLYVSPGTSQWNGFALRLFDPSEITLFTLHSVEQPAKSPD